MHHTKWSKLDITKSTIFQSRVFAQELSCQVRADEFLSETFIKQNWYQCTCQVNTLKKKKKQFIQDQNYLRFWKMLPRPIPRPLPLAAT